jgi:hypothetical protein
MKYFYLACLLGLNACFIPKLLETRKPQGPPPLEAKYKVYWLDTHFQDGVVFACWFVQEQELVCAEDISRPNQDNVQKLKEEPNESDPDQTSP